MNQPPPSGIDTPLQEPGAAAPPPEKKKSDLGPRLITSAIGVPVILWLLFWAPPAGFAILIGAAVVVATWEFLSMVTAGTNRVAQVITCVCALALFAVLLLRSTPTTPPDGYEVMVTLAFSGLAIFITYLFTYRDLDKVSLHIGTSGMALIYCAVMPTTLALLFRDGGDKGGLWVTMCMAVVWGSDTGAYFTGRAFGKHKLASRVSPKKTVEGAVGGLLTSIAVVLMFKFTPLMPELELWQVFALAVPANFLGQIGDLCESLIKRAHGVKDSGVIIYGHGGLLDRIDALIFAAPWFYVFQRYIAS